MITSKKNPWFRRFRDAIERHENEIALEGPKAIQDAVRLGWKPLAIAVDRPQIELAHDAHAIEFHPDVFAALSDTVSSQGIIALFERREAPLESLFADQGVVVALDGVQDPGNVGTMIRLAAAFAASGVALTEGCADPFGPKAFRASAGSALTLPVCRTTRTSLLRAIDKSGYELWAAAAGSNPNKPPLSRLVLAFGSEGQGVSPQLLKRAQRVSIPISDQVESLNVAAAAAILLSHNFEARFLLSTHSRERDS